MKKRFTFIAVAIVAVALILAMAACGEVRNGLSAYELAVKNGFEGTEQEWLDSLKGTDGIDGRDGTNGVNGKDGVNGKNGTDGKDNELTVSDYYQFAVENGFKGSELDFLDYLKVPYTTDNKYTVAKNLMSSVSVVCGFQVTTYNLVFGPGGLYYDKENPIVSKTYGAGSGVFYSINKELGEAYIITNYHVVYNKDADEGYKISNDISVFLYGGETSNQKIPATYIGGSLTYDIALLKIESSEALKTAEVQEIDFADSNEIVVGQTAIAIGNANGSGISATSGVVSVDSETLSMTAADETTKISFRVMRIDCAVNPGNSGGGLFDSEGNLIGIVNAKIIADNVENVGYAIPSNVVKYVVENILDNIGKGKEGVVEKCLLGVTVVASESKAVWNAERETVSIQEKVSVYEVYDEEKGTDTRIKETALVYGKLFDGDVFKSIKIDRGGTGEADEEYAVTRTYVVVDLMVSARVGDKIILVIERAESGEIEEVELTLTEECVDKVA